MAVKSDRIITSVYLTKKMCAEIDKMAARENISRNEQIRRFIEKGLDIESYGQNIAIFHNEGFVELGIDVEVQRAVVGKYKSTDIVKFKSVSAITAATLTYKGGYIQLSEANQAIANWISENGYEFDGSIFNIYHVSPETEPNPENLITEVCFPIRNK